MYIYIYIYDTVYTYNIVHSSASPKGGSEKGDPTNISLKGQVCVPFKKSNTCGLFSDPPLGDSDLLREESRILLGGGLRTLSTSGGPSGAKTTKHCMSQMPRTDVPNEPTVQLSGHGPQPCSRFL